MCGSKIDIIHEPVARSYCTSEHSKIVLYMGFGEGKEKKKMMQSNVSA